MTTRTAQAPLLDDVLLMVQALEIGFPGERLLPPISFELHSGEILTIIGHNGAGKSTLIKTVAGLWPRLGGTIENRGRRFAYVPQRETIDPIFPVSVEDFCSTGRFAIRGVGKWLHSSDYRIVEEALTLMEVWNLRKRLFRTLSGGEQQRVLLARALCMQPAFLILDEPTANMDHRGASAVMGLCAELARNQKMGVIMVNHFMDLVRSVSSRVVWLDRDEQRVEIGQPAEILQRFLRESLEGPHDR